MQSRIENHWRHVIFFGLHWTLVALARPGPLLIPMLESPQGWMQWVHGLTDNVRRYYEYIWPRVEERMVASAVREC